ncbi:MAG: hypothetical protein JSW67_12540 [Candidatus Latescibacterota bacterium]|nr:MAG: hypothetical protein JSW67_12540 [Candidatus Latescibacterota bacterium]
MLARSHGPASAGANRAVRLVTTIACVVALHACAPVLPNRTKPGGAARWAHEQAQTVVFEWARDAVLCRIHGVGVGNEGWLPDRGGVWKLSYWTPAKSSVLEVSVDSDGNVTSAEVDTSSVRGRSLPSSWQDSPRVWAATMEHQVGTPISTFAAVLAFDSEPQRYPDRAVWRIRFFLQEQGFETHVVSDQAEWLATY